jgi:predicted O-linked N-acetylglucosamine transferase (SPINDLY family)
MLQFPETLKRAVACQQRGNLREAERLCSSILKRQPDQFGAQHLLAILCFQQGRNEEAAKLFAAAVKIKPNAWHALINYGLVLQDLKRHDEALARYEQALAIKPNHSEALNNRGTALNALGRHEEALASYDRALMITPEYVEAQYNRGITLNELKRYDEALTSYKRVLAIKPELPEALYNLGVAFSGLERHSEALASYDRALAFRPYFAEALNNRGVALYELGRCDEALASHEKALSIRPDYSEALYNRGVILDKLRRNEEALVSYQKALSMRPAYVEALNNCGIALDALGRHEDALVSYEKALAIRPDYLEALNSRGGALLDLNRCEEALVSYDQALAVSPGDPHAFSGAARAASAVCDWKRTAEISRELPSYISKNKPFAPFFLLGYSADPVLQLQCAKNFTNDRIPVRPAALWNGVPPRHKRIRIAYLSADFREHAVAHLMAELIELHDRARFEVLGFSFGRDDRSAMRQRLANSFDQFHDVRMKSDYEVAKFLHGLEVDIAIDLAGYTQGGRAEVLSFRSTPVQVSYIGLTGTMGADFVDYIIADETVAPLDHQAFYTEKIVHLPDCYLVYDSRREIAERTPTRAQAGLPATGFVFCCFNNNYKITEAVFDVWMRLLRKVPASVLWLLRDNVGAERNLRREAQGRGVDPSRLIFADRMKPSEHLARHRLSDLFLDTLPYNAHTTACDALWTGVPVLTCQGATFAGRVASSLLQAVGLPELVTDTLEDYEARAFCLATDPSLLETIRQKLLRNRQTHPLFDSDESCRYIEAAYTEMWEICQRGERPRSFAVPRKDCGRT